MVERVLMPKILAIRSQVMTCARCNTWYMRLPLHRAQNDDFDQCDHCGSTSFKIREGRPYGPRSKQWPELIAGLTEYWQYMDVYEYRCFVTDPPLPDVWSK